MLSIVRLLYIECKTLLFFKIGKQIMQQKNKSKLVCSPGYNVFITKAIVLFCYLVITSLTIYYGIYFSIKPSPLTLPLR